MDKIYEFNGITKEDAINKAQEELKLDKEALDIRVKDSSKGKTMFSILDTNRVTIEVKVKKDKVRSNKFLKKDVERAKNNLEYFLENLKDNYNNIDLQYDIYEDGRKIYVEIDNNQKAKWIGYKGKILESMQRILQEVGTSDFRSNVRIYLNIGKYKEEKKRKLYSLSDNAVIKIESTKKEQELIPMNSYERKLVHDYLNDKGYETYSVGIEPNRHIIVKPKED